MCTISCIYFYGLKKRVCKAQQVPVTAYTSHSIHCSIHHAVLLLQKSENVWSFVGCYELSQNQDAPSQVAWCQLQAYCQQSLVDHQYFALQKGTELGHLITHYKYGIIPFTKTLFAFLVELLSQALVKVHSYEVQVLFYTPHSCRSTKNLAFVFYIV